MSESETIELASLGRPFQLGMLYDCRRDMLIPGITLWDAEMLQKDINVRPQPNTDFEIITSDTSEDKANALNVEASLKASFLGGMVSVKGSAKFLNDKKTSKRQSRVTLQYRTTTRFEQLTMNHLGAGNIQYNNVFQEGSATHVVTAVLYGAQAFFVFDQEISTSENQQEIQGSLQATIKNIPLISIEGQASLKMSEAEQQQANKLNCTFHGDFALENNPVTFQDALKVYCELPKLLGENREKAVPMRVWLYPLKKLDSAAAQLVRQISVGLVRRCQHILDEMDDFHMQCQDLLKDSMAIQFPEIKRKLCKFRDLCSEYKQVFQKFLCKLLPSIRGGGEQEQKLVDILTSKERSPFQSALMAEFLGDREREMNVVRSYLDIMEDVHVVHSSSDLDKIVLNQAHNYVVCFAFSSLNDKEEYLSDVETYLMEQSKGDASQVSYHHNTEEKAEKWFRSRNVIALTRQKIQLFLDFKQSNKSQEKLAFCIASIPDKLITASSVHVYERGTLLSAQFELPTKPGVPTVSHVEHDCVHLQIHPPANGVNNVQFYRVLYQTVQGSDWVEVNTDGKTEVTVHHLNPDTDYRFSCQAVCQPGVSLTSSATDFFRTRPSSPPGPPEEKSVESDCIKVTWDMPSTVGNDIAVIGYEVEHIECVNTGSQDSSCNTWKSMKTINRECTLEGLKADTPYSIRVSANCGKAGKSLPSSETVLRTIKACDSKPRPVDSIKIESERFLKQSTLLKKANPSIYTLELNKGFVGGADFEQYSFGQKVEKENNKVILLLGSTGAGKTTLVNVMINCILGVQWEDRYRFKLIDEQTNRTQAESQTSIVTSYSLHNQRGFQVPYSLTIVDTPGFGDTRGMSHDKQITEQVKRFLSSPQGIHHIDAVCFVVQASLARLSANQKYIFDSILSIFGKDIAENILILVTFADGKEIPALEAIQAADLPCHKNKKGKPTHFKFNNSALYAQSRGDESKSEDENSDEDEEDGDEQLEKIVWSTTFKQMNKFFKTIKDIGSKDLTLTKNVLEERERLENAMERLTPQISAGLSKLNEIKKLKQCLENEQETMTQNKDFEVEIEKLLPKRKSAPFLSTNCNNCLFSCHSGCFLPYCNEIEKCAAMDSTGHCSECPENCHFSAHCLEKALWEYVKVREKTTTQALKDNFMKAMGKFMSTKDMLEKLEDDFHLIEDQLMNLIKMSSNCLQRLEEIALKPHTLSTVEYVEILIRTEEDERKPGFEDRIVGLKKMKENAEILAKIARGEKLLPEERRIMKERNDRFKRIAKEIRGVQSVLQTWSLKK